MKLTPAQVKVMEAFESKNPENDWVNWQTLGLTGRSQNAMDALVKKGVLEKKDYVAVYRVVK